MSPLVARSNNLSALVSPSQKGQNENQLASIFQRRNKSLVPAKEKPSNKLQTTDRGGGLGFVVKDENITAQGVPKDGPKINIPASHIKENPELSNRNKAALKKV